MRTFPRLFGPRRHAGWRCALLLLAVAAPASPPALAQTDGAAGKLSAPGFEVALFQPDGHGEIRVGKGGGGWYEPIPFAVTVAYPPGGGGEWRPRRPLRALQPPVLTAGSARFRTLYEDGLEMDLLLELEGGVLRFAFAADGPPAVVKAGTMQITLRMPALGDTSGGARAPGALRFPEARTWEELKPLLAGFLLENTPVRGRIERFPYAEPVPEFTWDSKRFAIRGAYAPYRVELAGPTRKGAHLAMYLYKGMAPASGFTLCLQREPDSRGRPAEDRGLSMTFAVLPEHAP